MADPARVPQSRFDRQMQWVVGCGCAGLILAIVSIVGLGAVAVWLDPSIAKYATQVMDGRSAYVDDAYTDFLRELSPRMDLGANVRRANVDFDREPGPDGSPRIVFAIDLVYRGQCRPTGGVLCEREANEVAQLVFDHSRRLDRIDQIRVSMTRELSRGVLDPDVTAYSSTRAVEEWRQVLAAR